MPASLACGWDTGCGKELRAHAERKRLSYTTIAIITKCTMGNCSLDEVHDNHWHEQRLTLTIAIVIPPTQAKCHECFDDVRHQRGWLA